MGRAVLRILCKVSTIPGVLQRRAVAPVGRLCLLPLLRRSEVEEEVVTGTREAEDPEETAEEALVTTAP